MNADRRSGTSIVEALIALVLGLFLVHLGLSTMQRLQRFEERASRRHDALLSARIVRAVLRGELARARPGSDWIVGGDSLRLRAFRGTAVICTVGPAPGVVRVAYAGDRAPDPGKDSVEVTRPDGSIRFLGLASTRSGAGGCAVAGPGEELLAWTLTDTFPADAVLARVFESGAYHLAGSALRYRIGAGGRQPLTPEVWRDAATGLSIGDSAVTLELMPRPGYGRALSEFLSWRDR